MINYIEYPLKRRKMCVYREHYYYHIKSPFHTGYTNAALAPAVYPYYIYI